MCVDNLYVFPLGHASTAEIVLVPHIIPQNTVMLKTQVTGFIAPELLKQPKEN